MIKKILDKLETYGIRLTEEELAFIILAISSEVVVVLEERFYDRSNDNKSDLQIPSS